MALSMAGNAIRAVDLQVDRVRNPELSSGAFEDSGSNASLTHASSSWRSDGSTEAVGSSPISRTI